MRIILNKLAVEAKKANSEFKLMYYNQKRYITDSFSFFLYNTKT